MQPKMRKKTEAEILREAKNRLARKESVGDSKKDAIGTRGIPSLGLPLKDRGFGGNPTVRIPSHAGGSTEGFNGSPFSNHEG